MGTLLALFIDLLCRIVDSGHHPAQVVLFPEIASHYTSVDRLILQPAHIASFLRRKSYYCHDRAADKCRALPAGAKLDVAIYASALVRNGGAVRDDAQAYTVF